jgi:hypothetical protein
MVARMPVVSRRLPFVPLLGELICVGVVMAVFMVAMC